MQEAAKASVDDRVGRGNFPLCAGLENTWKPPPLRWIKINMNGACNSTTDMAACGGVGRDANMHCKSWMHFGLRF
ncbi:hypothetical protein V6N13_143749 [Hibiscus sabdariffa]